MEVYSENCHFFFPFFAGFAFLFPGFGAGIISPTLFGLILDAAGGNTSTTAWGFAYASQGMFCLVVPLLFLIARASIKR